MRKINQKLNKLCYVLLYIAPIILSLFILSNNTFTNASAIEYQSNTNLQFTFNPTISVSISDNLVIDNLSPGTAKDSNVINVNVATNNVSGYTLSATVGNSTTNPNNELTHITTPTYKFTSTSTDIAELSNLEPNTWGYNYSTNNGTNWHDYSTLPLYTDAGTTLNYKNNASNDNIKFKIGAKASNTQASGTYTNTINFTAITNPETHYYIKDFTLSQCEQLTVNDDFTVYDKRDESDYTVRYINGQCWMTQNLRITGTISAQYSNFEGEDFNVSEYDLTDTTHCNGGTSDDDPKGYSNACSRSSDSVITGAWYNYATATAGQITGYENISTVTQDICPSSWHLPSGPNTIKETDFNKLVGNQTSGWQDITAGIAAFDVVPGGYYTNGSLSHTERAYWWSSTGSNLAFIRFNLKYNSNNNQFGGDDSSNRFDGFFIRCVRSS